MMHVHEIGPTRLRRGGGCCGSIDPAGTRTAISIIFMHSLTPYRACKTRNCKWGLLLGSLCDENLHFSRGESVCIGRNGMKKTGERSRLFRGVRSVCTARVLFIQIGVLARGDIWLLTSEKLDFLAVERERVVFQVFFFSSSSERGF